MSSTVASSAHLTLQMARPKRSSAPPPATGVAPPPPTPTPTPTTPRRSKRKAVVASSASPAMGAVATIASAISPALKKRRIARPTQKKVPFPSLATSPEVINLFDEDDSDSNGNTLMTSRVVKPDVHIPAHDGGDLQVVYCDGEPLDVVLARACLYRNQNEFVLLQALKSSANEFFVWTRAGPVGTVGEQTMDGPYASRDHALVKFRSVFLSKTLVQWDQRHEQRFGEGGYSWIETHQATHEDEHAQAKPKRKHAKSSRARVSKKPAPKLVTEVSVARAALPLTNSTPPSTLDEQVETFLSMIMEAAASAYSNLDNRFYVYTKRPAKHAQSTVDSDGNTEVLVPLPLGKLSKATIERGFASLHRLHDAINCNADRTTLTYLSGRFYSLIPHVQLTVLDSMVRITDKAEMLVALCVHSGHHDLLLPELQTRYFRSNPLDAAYAALGCRLFPLQSTSQEYRLVDDYIFNSFCCVGTNAVAQDKLVAVFRVEKPEESVRFGPYRRMANRHILWHGSRMSNWVGILKQGLRITPEGIPINGSSLGAGLYFTDKIAKAMTYSHTSHGRQVFLLSEVALGECQPSSSASRKAAGSSTVHSCHGVGKCIPDAAGKYVDAFGAIWPMGKATLTNDQHATHGHNEFVVYNTAQARMRYIVVTLPLY